jgi:hypothetical protein
VLQQYPEIAVIEIDFVLLCDGEEPELLASHDYEPGSLVRATPLKAWIEMVVLQQKRLLWLDLKTRLSLWTLMSEPRSRLDVPLLLGLLNQLQRHFRKHCNYDIRKQLLLGCQDEQVYRLLCELNAQQSHAWRLLLDLPFADSYIHKKMMPDALANEWMQETYRLYAYAETLESSGSEGRRYICLDTSFFESTDAVKDFIQRSTLPRHSVLVLYSYPRTAPALSVPGYTILMQYDYTT